MHIRLLLAVPQHHIHDYPIRRVTRTDGRALCVDVPVQDAQKATLRATMHQLSDTLVDPP
jgi:hypothetical protein